MHDSPPKQAHDGGVPRSDDLVTAPWFHLALKNLWVRLALHLQNSDTESFLGMLFIASARYWIKFVHTAKYKSKPHAIAINTNQIAIFPNLGTCL
jgi:hypothetical protein